MIIQNPFSKSSPKCYRIPTATLGCDISVVEVGYNLTPSGLKQTMKRDVYILHYITKGKGVFLDKKFDKRCGYLVVPNELEVVEADKGDPYEAYWIMFKGASAPEMLKKCGLPTHNSVFEFDKAAQCCEIIKKALFDINPANEFEEKCVMQSAFYQIVALHMQSIKNIPASASTVAQKTKAFIDNNYHHKIVIDDLARENNYTRNYLYTLFKNEFDISPQEYLLSLRIEKAKSLLKDQSNKFSISETAYAVGFNDPLYFSRIFRKKTGLTPTEFRKA